ncbi:MAG: cytochrome b [Sphingomonadaceae bacterium]|nr:cytochrome b [Sphingomonadaceae bacterium]
MNGQARYSTVAMILHWVIAIAVIVNWRLAENYEHATEGADKFFWMSQHKALGITILVLTLLRLVWRFVKRPPDLAAHLAGWEKALAKVIHVIFYALLIGLPIGGWLASSYAGYPVDMWGLFELGSLPVGKDEAMSEAIGDAHGTVGKIMLILIVVHVLGALKHTFIDKDGNLFRMLPFGTPKA